MDKQLDSSSVRYINSNYTAWMLIHTRILLESPFFLVALKMLEILSVNSFEGLAS